jgi:hypothetical protein
MEKNKEHDKNFLSKKKLMLYFLVNARRSIWLLTFLKFVLMADLIQPGKAMVIISVSI